MTNMKLRSALAPVAAIAMAVLVPPASAQPGDERIPAFASAQFGWTTTHDDWLDPPPGSGHGPVQNDPAYPYLGSVEGSRIGKNSNVRLGDSKDPVLKSWAQEQMQKSNDEVLSGQREEPFSAQANCSPGGVPGQLLYPFEPVYFIQTPKEVWMIWQRDHMVRRVFLDRQHSTNLKPSWFGESIGHYENGDTLVVDTIGLSTHNSYLDNFRTPHTEQEHVTERFTISPDGKAMTAIARVDDPGAFNEPLTMKQVWFKANAPIEETVCAENNADFFQHNIFPPPQATTPDF